MSTLLGEGGEAVADAAGAQTHFQLRTDFLHVFEKRLYLENPSRVVSRSR